MSDTYDDEDIIKWRQTVDAAKARQAELAAQGLTFNEEAIEQRAIIGRYSQAIIRRRQLNARNAARGQCHQ